MTGHDDFDRRLAGWLEAEARPSAPGDGLDRVLDVTRRRRPRPAWLAGAGSDWVGEAGDDSSGSRVRSVTHLGLRWSMVLVLLLVIAALVGGAILVGAGRVRPSGPSHLAYGLDGDIYVADSDGNNAVRIADGLPNGAPNCGPAGFWGEGSMWSPDGHYLAYRSNSDQCPFPSVETVNVSDAQGHAIASLPSGVGWLVSWSPDSSRVAIWGTVDGTIGIYGLDGVRQALLTGPAGFGTYRDEDPIWSPDGTSIVVSLRPAPGGDPRQTWELPIDGRAPRPLPASDPRSRWNGFSYSPDGTSVAYIEIGPDLGCVGNGTCTAADWSLFVAAADGSQTRMLITGGVVGAPVWSPASDRIAFAVQIAGHPTNSSPSTELRVVDVASGTVTSLAGARGTDGLNAIRFSPEGDRILFARSNNGVPSLWSVRADGSGARLLVTGTGWGDWQP